MKFNVIVLFIILSATAYSLSNCGRNEIKVKTENSKNKQYQCDSTYVLDFNEATKANCEKGKEISEDKSILIEHKYPVDKDFHFYLSKKLNQDQRKHKGVKSLLELAGIIFSDESSVALDTSNSILYFYNYPNEHVKLLKLLESIYGASP